MDKIEKDGKIAVLYSPGYGASWSTWADPDQRETLCMDARIVAPFLTGDLAGVEAAALEVYPDFYAGGMEKLTVIWVEKGRKFVVNDYDGSESLQFIDTIPWMEA